jgi:WD40 repeat protein/serine/threonine protein kinase
MVGVVSEPARDELVGRTLGEFVVRGRLAEGGFGAVYRAQQPLLGRDAVIKVLRTQFRQNEHAIQRFLREARLASRLDHPYAAHIYAFGAEQDGLLWIAMELVDGIPLDRMLRDRGRFALDQAIPFLERLCEVVDTAHGKGIIHRDIKPSNVMVLARSGQLLPKLLDLGIAKSAMTASSEPAIVRRDSAPVFANSEQVGHAATAELAATREPALTATADTSGATPPHKEEEPAGRMLTQDGTVLGSPPYMAPEQWKSSATATERTDVYALGVLAFELLTGKRPFEARTLGELFTQHTEHPVPSLGAGFPEALDGVLAKALAKKPEDRYAAPLELGIALRAAAGLSPEVEVVPRLDPKLRDTWIAGAPQPIAEAIAALEAARSVREARDTYRDVTSALLHYVGVLALACHSELGSSSSDLARVVELVRELRRRTFSDDDWRALIQALAASRPASELAIPELTAVADHLGSGITATLAQARTDRQIREQLAAGIAGLESLLGELGFLLGYPLGVARDDHVELWMGVRRLRRSSIALAGAAPAGTPVVLGAAGKVLLVLEPLVEVARPTPGAPEELFLLDGRGNRGARLVALPIGFERNREDVWAWFGSRYLDTTELPREVADAVENPYPGLSAFTTADAAQFFGREREVETFANRLRVQSLLAVVGASGSGKSSFVQAGVIPNLPTSWRAITIRPGPTPLGSLDAVLRKLDRVADLVADRDAFGRELRAAGEAGGTIVLVIDQFEELFTLSRDPEQRLAFVDAIVRAARAPDDPVRIVLTLRDDFLIAAEQLAPLRDRLTWGLQLLASPSREDLQRILTEPARRAGFAFEDAALANEMIDSVIAKPGSLALLAYTAAELWSERDRETKLITRKSYDAMGGVGGALARHADGVVEAMVAEERRLVREAFRHVITAEGTRAVIGRDDLRRVLADPRAEAVIEKLIEARLLVTAEGPDGEDRIEIVHEALLEAWPRLRDWLREDAEGVRLRDQLRTAARQWQDRGRPAGLLWRGDALAEYERWRKRYPGKLAELDEAFAVASVADARRGRRFRNATIATGFVVLASAVVILIYLRSRAESLSAAAREQYVAGLVEQGRRALQAGDSLGAAGHLVHAYDEGARGRALGMMLARAVHPLKARLRSFSIGAPVRSADLDREGIQIAVVRVGDPHVSVLDIAGGPERRFDTSDANVYGAAFDPRGTRLAVGGTRPRLWDLRGTIHVELETQGMVGELTWTEDGTRVVGLGAEGLYVWDAATGRKRITIPFPATQIAVHGDQLAAGNPVGLVRVYDLATGAQRFEVRGHAGLIRHIAFAPDGATLGSTSEDRTAQLWDAGTGRHLATLAHEAAVTRIAFHASGLAVTSSLDGTAKVWKRTGELVRSLLGHGRLRNVVFDPDGTRVLTAAYNGRACIHEVASGTLLDCLEGHTVEITASAWSRDGQKLVTASFDGTVRVWRADARRFAASITHAAETGWSAWSPDGRWIVTADWAGNIKLSTRAGAMQWQVRAHDGLPAIEISADGRSLVTVNAVAKLWDLPGGKLQATLRATDKTQFTIGGVDSDVLLLATAGGTLELRSRAQPDQLRTIKAHDAAISFLAVSPDGTRVAASADQTIRVFELATGRRLQSLEGHTAPVVHIAYDPTDQRLATHDASTVRVWSHDGKSLHVMRSEGGLVRQAIFDRAGTLFVGYQDGGIRMWNRAGQAIGVLRGHESSVQHVAVDPRGGFVASADRDGVAILWDTTNKTELMRLHGHTDEISTMSYTRDGTSLATASFDRTIKLWEIDDGGTSLADELELARDHIAQDSH